MKTKKKYEAPSEYRILYKRVGEVGESYHYYSCYSGQEALSTFNKVAEKRDWSNIQVIRVEKFDRWHNTWAIQDNDSE